MTRQNIDLTTRSDGISTRRDGFIPAASPKSMSAAIRNREAVPSGTPCQYRCMHRDAGAGRAWTGSLALGGSHMRESAERVLSLGKAPGTAIRASRNLPLITSPTPHQFGALLPNHWQYPTSNEPATSRSLPQRELKRTARRAGGFGGRSFGCRFVKAGSALVGTIETAAAATILTPINAWALDVGQT